MYQIPTESQIRDWQQNLVDTVNEALAQIIADYVWHFQVYLGVAGVSRVGCRLYDSHICVAYQGMLCSALEVYITLSSPTPIFHANEFIEQLKIELIKRGYSRDTNGVIVALKYEVFKPFLVKGHKNYTSFKFSVWDNRIRPIAEAGCICFDEQRPLYLEQHNCPDVLGYPVFNSDGLLDRIENTRLDDWRSLVTHFKSKVKERTDGKIFF